jgi:zinc protease
MMKFEVRSSKFKASLMGFAVAASLATAGVVAQQAPDRSKIPEPGAPPALKLPPIQKRTLANGLQVWIVEMHEVPVVNLTMVVKAGASADPNGKYGLASFTAAMLDEGAGGKTALELADAVEFLGAGLSTGSSFDSSSIRLQAPVSRLDEALPLMADVLLRPAFSQAEVDRLRKERLTSLVQTKDNPSALASAAFARLVFGPRHRYGTPAMGNQTSNTEMTPADLRAFYTSYYQPQNAHLIVVGDVTPAALLPKHENELG